jgi:hypothetical protein
MLNLRLPELTAEERDYALQQADISDRTAGLFLVGGLVGGMILGGAFGYQGEQITNTNDQLRAARLRTCAEYVVDQAASRTVPAGTVPAETMRDCELQGQIDRAISAYERRAGGEGSGGLDSSIATPDTKQILVSLPSKGSLDGVIKELDESSGDMGPAPVAYTIAGGMLALLGVGHGLEAFVARRFMRAKAALRRQKAATLHAD